MRDLLRKIGIPTTVATVIATLVVTVPFFFQLDERYAKSSALEKHVRELERKSERLSREIAQLSGYQEAMVSLIQDERVPRSVVSSARRSAPVEVDVSGEIAAGSPAPGIIESAPPIAVGSAAPVEEAEKPRNWNEIADGLRSQQRRLNN